jgi:Flp pilus assembly protein TadD
MRGLCRTLLAAAIALAVAGCAGGRHSANAQSSPDAKPPPLSACETRELTLDGTVVVVSSNADGTLASATVVAPASPAARAKTLRHVRAAFGPSIRDSALIAHASKWGLTTWTDRCGHPVKPPAPIRLPASPRGSPAHD